MEYEDMRTYVRDLYEQRTGYELEAANATKIMIYEQETRRKIELTLNETNANYENLSTKYGEVSDELKDSNQKKIDLEVTVA